MSLAEELIADFGTDEDFDVKKEDGLIEVKFFKNHSSGVYFK